MKKLLLSLMVVFIAAGVSLAQEQGEIRLSAGLALGTEAGVDDDGGNKLGVGINLGGEYLITDVISAGINYTYFFKSSIGEGDLESSYRLSSFNIDGKYYFLTDNIQVYGLAGIAVMGIKIEYTDVDVDFTTGEMTTVKRDFKDSETGLNIGGGVILPLTDVVGFNGQLKYQTPGTGQLVLSAGIVYSLDY